MGDTERKLEPRRMSGIQKARLMDLLRQAKGVDEGVADLHHALRCHFHWEDTNLPGQPIPGVEIKVTAAADFDPTLEQDSELARSFNEVLDRYLKIGGSIPEGFREALWSLVAEVGEVPPLSDVAPARLMFEVTAQTERRRLIKQLQRDEMPKDCLACKPDYPCEACLQTARIVGTLEGSL